MRWKKWGAFLALLALLGGGAALLFWDLAAECLSILATGQGSEEYVLTAADGRGSAYALGWRGERLQLVKAGVSGEREDLWALPAELLPRQMRPAALYPASGGAVYVGLYDLDRSPAELQLYRFSERGRTAELLLSEPCRGDGLQEQMNSVRLSAFSEVDSVVTFAVLREDTAQFYQRVSASSGLEKLRTVSQPGLETAMALSDGSLLLAGQDALVHLGSVEKVIAQGTCMMSLAQAGTGVCYVDGTSLEVFYSDLTDWRPVAFLELEKDAYDIERCTHLAVTRDEDVLLLMEGKQLLLDRGSTVVDLSGALYRPRVQCALILAALALGVLAAAGALWYVVCEQQKLRLPLLVRWGVLSAAAAAVAVACLVRWGVWPQGRAAAQQEAFELIGSTISLTLPRERAQEDSLSLRLSRSLVQTESGRYRDTAVSLYARDEEGLWRLEQSNTSIPAGRRAELCPGFDRAQAGQAMETGSARWSYTQGNETRWVLYRQWGANLLAVDVEGSPMLEAVRERCRWMEGTMTALAVLLTALLWIVLCIVTRRVRQVARGMERIAAGERGVHLRLSGGDELTSLGEALNALSGSLEDLERSQSELAQSYRRFVPERVLSLLGKTSITQVDKQTFVSRDLTAMMLRFQLPPEVYERSGRELFDSINEILERTASIVTNQGGAVFNFAYDGYDAVFEQGSAAGVSTAVAVQQEVLELNREREAAGRSPVAVHIALDKGTVMLGVVGDENQIEPASISSSFTTVRHLLELCGRLQASILCTEAVAGGAAGYSARYMGKCAEGGGYIRTYELFDGDPYEVRKVKEASGERFSEGVYALYSRDFSRAKRIFLNLVHANTGDGGARYYLYLADRLEKEPEAEISLDQGEDREGSEHGHHTA